MTLSQFLENKKERTQLPSKTPLNISYERNQLPDTEPIGVNINSTDRSIGYTDTDTILSMLNDTVASRNFVLTTLVKSQTVSPNTMLNNMDAIISQDGDPKAKALQKLARSLEKKDVLVTNKAIGDLGILLENQSQKLYYDDMDNIKGTGLAVDGFSGGPHKSNKSELGLVPNKGTMSAGGPVDNEAFRKAHLRNYWKYAEGNPLRAPAKAPSAASNDFKDLLNKRLRGVSKEQAAKGSFLTGYGLSAKEFSELMLNDKIEHTTNGKNSSIDNLNSLLYGMEAKRDMIIDSGRFSYDASSQKWQTNVYASNSLGYGHLWSPYERSNYFGKVIFNLSSYGADPARTPYFRKQILSLGNEVTFANLAFDPKYVTTNGFSIKLINSDSNTKGRPHADWVFDDKSRGNSKKTPIAVIAHRYPDFMGNMSYVFFSTSESVPINNINGIRFCEQNLIDIEPARVLDISVKMPEMKIEQLDFVNRTIAVLSNSINMSHQASIKIRLDENLNVYRRIFASAGLLFEDQGTGDIGTNDGQIRNQLNQKGNAMVLRNTPAKMASISSISGGVALETDLYVAYNLITNFLPLENPTDASTPYSKDVINYKHANNNDLYSRYFIFRGVQFLGVPELTLSKETTTTDMSFNFTFKSIDEAEYGHSYDAATKTGTVE